MTSCESSALDPDCFASELVDHGQKAKLPAIDRLINDEVVTPDVVRTESPIFVCRALAAATPLTLLLRHLQAFTLPNESQSISADRDSFGL
jgi:hypothetical protein